MDRVEPASNALDQPDARSPGTPVGPQQFRQVATLDVFHREPQPSVILAAVVDPDDGLVLHLAGEIGLRAEAAGGRPRCGKAPRT